jgi:acyl-CoA synthetase (AMP-forming)/AMP-acid ligase II
VGRVERKIVDPETGADLPIGAWGELCLRNHDAMMLGFYRKERLEAFDRDGWYHTGDRCMLNDEGYLFFSGRLSDMIKVSGANVSPREVEEVLMAEPDIAEAAVLAITDDLGDSLVAAVIPREGYSLEEEELKGRLKKQLSSYKVPRRFVILRPDEVPRTVSDKVRKPVLLPILKQRLAKSAG